jgi:hypothetical protein
MKCKSIRESYTIISTGTGAPSPGVKRPEREADHSPASSADVKNGGAIPPLPTYIHAVGLNFLGTGTLLVLLPSYLF